MATLEEIQKAGGSFTPLPKITAETLNSGIKPAAITPVAQSTIPFQTITSSNADAVIGEYAGQLKSQEDAVKNAAQNRVDYMGILGGQTADLQSAQQQTGVNEATTQQNEYLQQLANLNAQATSLQREAQAVPIQVQQEAAGKGVTDRGVAPIETARLRENALKALSIAQQSDIASAALTGSTIRLAQAKEKAQQIVDLKYKPIEDALAREKELYTLNKDLLERTDKKRSEALALAIKKDEEATAERKASEKEVSKLIVDASPYAPANILAKAKEIKERGGSSVEVAMTLGKYGGDFLGDLVKRSTLAKNDLEMQKVRKEIKALDTPLPVVAPFGSNAHFNATLLNSAVHKESLSQTERTAVTKNLTVLDQLDALQQNISKQNNTGFFKGKVNNFFAAIGQNADVGTINAQLQAIVPNLARGVYGEVGVLTDNDIENYRKTLPNLTSPQAQNDAVLALTLKVVQKNLKNTLETAANSKMDVSRFTTQYNQVSQKINEINDRIGVTDAQVKDYADTNPELRPMIEQLIVEGRKGSEILQILGVEN